AAANAVIRDHLKSAAVDGERNIHVEGGAEVFAPGEDHAWTRIPRSDDSVVSLFSADAVACLAFVAEAGVQRQRGFFLEQQINAWPARYADFVAEPISETATATGPAKAELTRRRFRQWRRDGFRVL